MFWLTYAALFTACTGKGTHPALCVWNINQRRRATPRLSETTLCLKQTV